MLHADYGNHGQSLGLSFQRDFNHHFNTMIIAHELMPGHYLQLKLAARHPRRARFLYADSVFVEGWGTFSERLMLEQGWGDDLAYAAHLKKQLENKDLSEQDKKDLQKKLDQAMKDKPLTEKQKVIGPNAHPFYRWVEEILGADMTPRWNFHKYLIDPEGDIVASWPSRVTPEAPELQRALAPYLGN